MPTPIRFTDGDEPIGFVGEPETTTSGSFQLENGNNIWRGNDMPRLNRFPSGAYEPLTISSSSSPFRVEPSNISAPLHIVHVRLYNGSVFTEEDIRRWADGQLCGIAIGEEEQVIKALARIIVQAS